MNFLISNGPTNSDWTRKEIAPFNIYFNQGYIKENELVFETAEVFILVNANNNFLRKVSDDPSYTVIRTNLSELTNGYIIFYDKRTRKVRLLTDAFGFFHVYYIRKDGDIHISSDYRQLLNFSNKKPDDFAILDIALFNYTLLDRTLVQDIKRLKGGSEMILGESEFSLSTLYNFADNYIRAPQLIDFKEFAEMLRNSVDNEIIDDRSTWLTITAGFDTRALLAASVNLGLHFSSLTFGQDGNIEQVVSNTFIGEFSENHLQILLDDSYIRDLPYTLDRYVESTMDNPVILDLPHYMCIKEMIAGSNLITGFMGGEIISGQSIGSQVTFTSFAAKLLTTENSEDLHSHMINEIARLNIFDNGNANTISIEYINTLKEYFKKGDRTNILKFLINEKYSKFFGSVNKLFTNSCNLVVPFMNVTVLNCILNSQISFLSRKPFRKNPFSQIRAKILYSKAILHLCPTLGNTKFDRLYSLKDLSVRYRFPRVIAGYIQSHYFRVNKKYYPKPHDYDHWYGDIVPGLISRYAFKYDSGIFRTPVFISKDYYNALPSKTKKKVAVLAAAMHAIDKINRGGK
jgi:hypothetical protein